MALVIGMMTNKMNEFATELQFEKANEMKEALVALKNYQAKSTIVSSTLNNIDVFSFLKQLYELDLQLRE